MDKSFPKLAAPAQRALAGAGITSLPQLSNFTEAQIAALHGIGNNALQALKKAMAEAGITFKQSWSIYYRRAIG